MVVVNDIIIIIMPQRPSSSASKRRKGRAPAHQNTFAFKHNPKSKLTDKILSSPNQHVCRRCHDKIEWRKQYRKYKPRTQPGKCNQCGRRNVLAAYHTLCTKCTVSDKAKRALLEIKGKENKITKKTVTVGHGDIQKDGTEEEPEQSKDERQCDGHVDSNDQEEEDKGGREEEEEEEPQSQQTKVISLDSIHRVCAICAKERALPDPEVEAQTVEDMLRGRKVSLRERRALERRLEREEEEARIAAEEAKLAAKEARRREVEGDVDEEDDDESQDDEEALERPVRQDHSSGTGSKVLPHEVEKSVEANEDGNDEEEEDPFLKAVGGANKLLTGEAYQQMLLARERTKQ